MKLYFTDLHPRAEKRIRETKFKATTINSCTIVEDVRLITSQETGFNVYGKDRSARIENDEYRKVEIII